MVGHHPRSCRGLLMICCLTGVALLMAVSSHTLPRSLLQQSRLAEDIQARADALREKMAAHFDPSFTEDFSARLQALQQQQQPGAGIPSPATQQQHQAPASAARPATTQLHITPTAALRPASSQEAAEPREANPPTEPATAEATPSATPRKVPPPPQSRRNSDMLQQHNDLRFTHQVAPLSWSPSLAADAQRWADGCYWGHEDQGTQGDNIAIGYPSVTDAIKVWADERYQYTFGEPTPDRDKIPEVGHFTQMVWKQTTELGCGVAQCSRGEYVVCRYSPQGNVLGQFHVNVLPARR